MVRFYIRVNTGDNNRTHKYYFIHKNYDDLTDDEQKRLFDIAVKELNKIYKTYGRFATSTGVINFFESHGFEHTISN